MSRIITEIAGFAPCLKMHSFGQMSRCEIPLSHASKGTLQAGLLDALALECPKWEQYAASWHTRANVWLERMQAAKLKD